MEKKTQTLDYRVGVSFTKKEIEILDTVVESGHLGNSRAEGIRFMFRKHVEDNYLKSQRKEEKNKNSNVRLIGYQPKRDTLDVSNPPRGGSGLPTKEFKDDKNLNKQK